MTNYVHIFSGQFGSEARAYAYAEQQVPAEAASEVAYIVWEDRNPFWPMREELNARYLDSSFIETVWSRLDGKPGADWDYLGTFLSWEDVAQCQAKAKPESDTLILIFQEALGGASFQLQSPAMITYCGSYAHTAFA